MGLLDSLGKLLGNNANIMKILFMLLQQSGGLENLLSKLQRGNESTRHAVGSWVNTGPNAQISVPELENALGPDTITKVSEQTGMERQDLLGLLAQNLPQFIDQLTPDGSVNHNSHALVTQAQEKLDVPRL
ncbi:YidB family protein [Deinococcus misasensis]|uniref:YidB family protein n=1 Tax=Deinococcus misasensis TaxID=392413 RepID=UPI00068E0624|nr:YidB family protein [Deinococcus misasensis]